MVNVAVITPVYNTQEYLHRCIKSVLGQDGVSLQYFIVDDGSTDNSASIARFYQQRDKRVTLIQKVNEGQGLARNVGIKLADAEFIYFVDSDDYLGENTLSILYNTAQKHKLDICSPAVPKHYFDKPLEAVPCLPSKSQFIRADIIREHDIKQPDIRSGQDGVFSHLVLTHCKRIGMASNAVFNYTHAREGSTFALHLKRHDLVPTLVRQHYDAITAHYDKHDLWAKNALRLLAFISDETLRNRIAPHFPHFTPEQKIECFSVLKSVAVRAYDALSYNVKKLVHPIVAEIAKQDLEIVIKRFKGEGDTLEFAPVFPKNKNIAQPDLLIVKYADESLAPSVVSRTHPPENSVDVQQNRHIPEREENVTHDYSQQLQHEVRVLRGKLDLAINTINNATVQLCSATRSAAPTCEGGEADLVVSLTTLPHRLNLVHYAIESILSQTIRPGRICLWLTEKTDLRKAMTPELEALKSRGLEIRQVEDVGPHTKLIYALKEFPDKSIVTVDDDIVYPINMLQCLWDQHVRFPRAVVSNWARELAFDAAGVVKGVRSGKLLTPPLLESELEQAKAYQGAPNILAFPYGTSGVLYPPGSLHECVFDASLFKKLCPKEDDIWFKAMGLLNRTPVVVTNLGINPVHHCIVGSQSDALRHVNHGNQKNVEQMKNAFEHFNLYKYLVE